MLVALPLRGGAAAVLATYVHRHLLGDPLRRLQRRDHWRARRIFCLTAPMAILLVLLLECRTRARRYVAAVHLHNDRLVHKAIGYLDRAIELSPNEADLLNLRGIAWSRAGDQARAAADWDRVLELEPKSAEPFLNRGVDALRRGDLDEALDWLQRALKVNSKQVQGRTTTWGVALERRGELDPRRHSLRSRDQAASRNPRLRVNRAYAHFRARPVREGGGGLRRGARALPGPADGLCKSGHATGRAG